MGAWSTKPFGNDNSLDWLRELQSSDDGAELILKTLNIVGKANDQNSSIEIEEPAVAAAAIVSAASVDPIGRLSKDAKDWINEKGYVPDRKSIQSAIDVLEKIKTDSELRELWKEGNSYGTWLKDINFFLANLKSAINSSLSKRKPKKKGMPRVLHKLVERYASNPDEKLRKKIHDKLSALEDVNICSQETNYHAPLVLVARYGLVEEASILLDKGADPNFTNERLGFYTALVYACDNGHLNMVKLLIKSGANSFQESDIDAKTGRPIEMIDEKENVEIEKYHSSIALSCAVKRGNLEIIDFLLTRGIDINKTEMLRIACEAGNTKSVAHLIKLGVDLDKVTKTGNEPPLHFAVCGNHFEIVKQLLESGANPNIVEKYRSLPERTILDLIEDRPNSEVFKLIRSFGGLFYKEIREKRSAN